MMALITANVVNAAGNWILIWGHWGFPALGTNGSAWATVGARIYLAVFLFVVILVREKRNSSGLHDVPFFGEFARVWRLARLGWPAATQIALEVGVFATASALSGRISPLAIGANQVVLNIASFVFMIPLGLSAATAVRTGQAVGRRDPAGIRLAGKCGLLLFSYQLQHRRVDFVDELLGVGSGWRGHGVSSTSGHENEKRDRDYFFREIRQHKLNTINRLETLFFKKKESRSHLFGGAMWRPGRLPQ
jgi:hypothetical protein